MVASGVGNSSDVDEVGVPGSVGARDGRGSTARPVAYVLNSEPCVVYE